MACRVSAYGYRFDGYRFASVSKTLAAYAPRIDTFRPPAAAFAFSIQPVQRIGCIRSRWVCVSPGVVTLRTHSWPLPSPAWR